MNKWESILKYNRKGMFFIDKKLIKDKPDLFQRILSNLLIVEARPRFILDSMVYFGYHEVFDTLNEGDKVPVYDLIIDESDKEDVKWTFKKSTQDVIFL